MTHQYAYGWLPDFPDFRDATPDTKNSCATLDIPTALEKIHLENDSSRQLPATMDLRQWCAPIENQGNLGSCTANAGVGLLEYFERKAFGQYVDGSRLFLYKVTRNLLNWTGDTGAFLRTTIGAMKLFGIPPEKYFPYYINNQINPTWDEEPAPFLYGYAQHYQALSYFRLDLNITTEALLQKIKKYLAGSYPLMFGFSVYSSIEQAAQQGGDIPFPTSQENLVGGHAVVAVGYDDNKKIDNQTNGTSTTGAFLIRNSWGIEWGDQGYGWLPYKYILTGLATDWWSLITNEWIDTQQFGF